MPFGFISRNELERYQEAMREEFAVAVADQKALYAKLELEWTDMFDRFRRLYAKIAKRAGAESEAPEQPQPSDGAGGGDNRPGSSLLQQRRAMRGW